jgi:anti-sigma regulatory factor (Ser/Thr protein kinase)
MRTAFDFEFHPDPAVVRTARDATNVLAPTLSRAKIDDLRLLVSEVVTNAVRHGGVSSDEWIRVRVSLGRERVRVEVSNPGTGFDSEPGDGLGVVKESGWGMYLLDRLADRWGITSGDGTCVWFELEV